MPRRRLVGRAGLFLAPVLVVGLLVLAWQLYCLRVHPDPTVLPSPARIARQGWLNRAAIASNAVPTLVETLAGFGVSLVASWVLAAALDLCRPLRRGIYPLLIASQTVPVLAVAPLLIIWFGFGLLPKVLVVAVTTFFPMTVALLAGFAATEPAATQLLRSMAAGRLAEFCRLRVPSALPYFFAGLRVSVSYAVISAVFAEYVGASQGLGIYLQSQQHAFRTDLVLACVLAIAAMSMALFAAAVAAQWILLPWQRAARRRR